MKREAARGPAIDLHAGRPLSPEQAEHARLAAANLMEFDCGCLLLDARSGEGRTLLQDAKANGWGSPQWWQVEAGR